MLFKSSFTSRFKRPFSFQIDIKVHSITQTVVDDELHNKNNYKTPIKCVCFPFFLINNTSFPVFTDDFIL